MLLGLRVLVARVQFLISRNLSYYSYRGINFGFRVLDITGSRRRMYIYRNTSSPIGTYDSVISKSSNRYLNLQINRALGQPLAASSSV